jgi:hypothetical protein
MRPRNFQPAPGLHPLTAAFPDRPHSNRRKRPEILADYFVNFLSTIQPYVQQS